MIKKQSFCWISSLRHFHNPEQQEAIPNNYLVLNVNNDEYMHK